jgi:hypothetical protein
MLELQQKVLFCDRENLIATPRTSFPLHHLNNCTPAPLRTPSKMKAAVDHRVGSPECTDEEENRKHTGI